MLVSERNVIQGDAQRAAYWRWAGFLALNFNRRTEVELCTSVDTKPFSPPIANTMLWAGFLFIRLKSQILVLLLSIISLRLVWCRLQLKRVHYCQALGRVGKRNLS